MFPCCVTPVVKHGGESKILRGSFAASGVCDLHKVSGTLKQKHHSFLTACPQVGQGFILQQETDPKQTSRLCQNYWTSNDGWPAQCQTEPN